MHGIITDYSDAEIAALEEGCRIATCVIFIVNKHEQDGSMKESIAYHDNDCDLLLELLRDCGWAPSGKKYN